MSSPAKPKFTRRPRSRSRRFFFFVLKIVVLVALLVTIVYGFRALRVDIKQVGQIPQRTLVYDVNGDLYSRLYGENRLLVPLEDVSPHFVDALLAREDNRFYHHFGFDPIGIARAIVRNLSGGGLRQGASTITQQLARNSFPLGGRNLDRKLLEAFVALRIEFTFSKRQILEHYINRIYYGSGYYGLEIASQAYFGKPSKDLTLGESALMAGLIRSPNRFSPLRNLTGALRERDTVLNRMVSVKKITSAQAAAARRAPIRVASSRKTVVQENYAMDAVDEELRVLLDQDQIDSGGMKIYTTLHPVLQKTAQAALDEQLVLIEKRSGYQHPKKAAFTGAEGEKTPYLQGSIVVIDNRSGGIAALVGGRDHGQSSYNRALLSRRQIGSTAKPFVYAAAFENGLFPESRVSDGPIEDGEVPEAPEWRPSNSDGGNRGILPARDGLTLSRNTMTVRVGNYAGEKKISQLASRSGLHEMPASPVSWLGAFEDTPRNLTAAYTVFPNRGERKQAYLIERIDDRFGLPIYRAAHIKTRAIDPGASWLTTLALRDTFTRGTASSARSQGFTQIAGGKTGTTNDFKDAWFVGFTSSLTCGVWVGLDKPTPIVSRGYGGTLALPIWIKVMKSAPPAEYPAVEFQPGVALKKVLLCSVSNAGATTACQRVGTAYTTDLPVTLIPKSICTVHSGSSLATAEEAREEEDRGPSLPNRVIDSILNIFRRR